MLQNLRFGNYSVRLKGNRFLGGCYVSLSYANQGCITVVISILGTCNLVDIFVRQYRKFGRIYFFTSNCTFIHFVLSALCLFLGHLPLPSIEEVAQMTGPKMEWQLGASWQHFLQANGVTNQ